MNYLLIVLGVVCAIAVGIATLQTHRLETYQEALAKSEANRAADQQKAAEVNKQNMETILTLREAAAENRVRIQFTNEKLNNISEANAVLREKYNEWRAKLESETIKRPRVVARAARRAIRGSMRRAECITDSNCNPSPNGEPANDIPKAAKGNKPKDAGTGDADAADNKEAERVN